MEWANPAIGGVFRFIAEKYIQKEHEVDRNGDRSHKVAKATHFILVLNLHLFLADILRIVFKTIGVPGVGGGSDYSVVSIRSSSATL